ncbi:hypothetical protein Q8791_08835 [Nocardiopsis sp. CT-R113]|uniref:Uncharacterized protein n=1 Tax=Nocardiopsis codii TaxID=3065942 RepID=A0ABU7K503_9ACTN|nr:hypothetical protein [Nocardiopsis sp. CT-R113]MEE2037325.1 hypothetical protein [Nocardiopsis sp. CT-R113]
MSARWWVPGTQYRRARERKDTEQPTTFDVLQKRFFPEGQSASRRVRISAWAITTVVALLIAAGGFAGTYAYDLWSTEARMREERAAQTAIDQGNTPFTNSVAYETSPQEGSQVVLDRPLTTDEAEELVTLDNTEAGIFLASLGGRLISETSVVGGITPPSGWSWEGSPAPIRVGSAVFTMTVLSARTSQVSIVDMNPTNVSCTEPTATTVVEFPSAGQAIYPGVLVDLTHNDPTLLISDEGTDQGQPYFNRRRIDLGGGLEPGGLRVQAVTAGQSCEWEIQAHYVDARQNSGEVVLRNGDEPFFVEAAPARPEQYWILTPGPGVVACHETPELPGCPNAG